MKLPMAKAHLPSDLRAFPVASPAPSPDQASLLTAIRQKYDALGAVADPRSPTYAALVQEIRALTDQYRAITR